MVVLCHPPFRFIERAPFRTCAQRLIKEGDANQIVVLRPVRLAPPLACMKRCAVLLFSSSNLLNSNQNDREAPQDHFLTSRVAVEIFAILFRVKEGIY